jgi:polysaccharide pyruvyl transferase WcaK-like protein
MCAADDDDPRVVALAPSGRRRTLGINLSPLSLLFAHGAADQKAALLAQVRLIETILRQFDVDALLVPHVICPWHPVDDDLSHLQLIESAIALDLRDRVRCLPGDLGARRTKAIIGQCDALMAARMHCAIAGVSSGVPTLFLSYSEKSKGMAEFVYGDKRWLASIDTPQSDLLSKVGELLGQAGVLREYLQAQGSRFESAAVIGGEALASVLAGRIWTCP